MQKGQQTEDKTCIKLGPGRLCAQMETHQHPPPSAFIIYTSNTRRRGISRRRGRDTVILGNRRNLWQFLSEHKHLRKNSCTASCPLLQLRLCQSSVQLLGITILGPFCSLGLCQTQTYNLFNTPVGSQHFFKSKDVIWWLLKSCFKEVVGMRS
jgi:hypothetical protein